MVLEMSVICTQVLIMSQVPSYAAVSISRHFDLVVQLSLTFVCRYRIPWAINKCIDGFVLCIGNVPIIKE